jgi:predicted nucleic-acid-binding Zn-ribbon protein
MEIQKKTWCPKCGGNLERLERVTCTGGMWPKKLFIIYKCDSCIYESVIDLKLTDRLKKRLRKRLELRVK